MAHFSDSLASETRCTKLEILLQEPANTFFSRYFCSESILGTSTSRERDTPWRYEEGSRHVFVVIVPMYVMATFPFCGVKIESHVKKLKCNRNQTPLYETFFEYFLSRALSDFPTITRAVRKLSFPVRND